MHSENVTDFNCANFYFRFRFQSQRYMCSMLLCHSLCGILDSVVFTSK